MFQGFESIGIGLCIVKNIISRNKGKISLKSTPNNGTTFYFNLHKSCLNT
jgi:light-regulated signal transduction histidine kinase (bacteriophytochrome)